MGLGGAALGLNLSAGTSLLAFYSFIRYANPCPYGEITWSKANFEGFGKFVKEIMTGAFTVYSRWFPY